MSQSATLTERNPTIVVGFIEPVRHSENYGVMDEEL